MAAKPGPLRPHEERRTYTRRRPVEPPPDQPGLGDSFLILTEGEVTERMYFEALRTVLLVNPVTVRVVHPGCTDAEGLVRAAVQERDAAPQRRDRCEAGNRQVSHYDHVWVTRTDKRPAYAKRSRLALFTRATPSIGHRGKPVGAAPSAQEILPSNRPRNCSIRVFSVARNDTRLIGKATLTALRRTNQPADAGTVTPSLGRKCPLRSKQPSCRRALSQPVK